MSSKFQNILARLPALAVKSLNTHQHGAVLLKNGVPVSFGFNAVSGINFRHAEVDAINRYLRQQCLKRRFKEKSCLLHR